MLRMMVKTGKIVFAGKCMKTLHGKLRVMRAPHQPALFWRLNKHLVANESGKAIMLKWIHAGILLLFYGIAMFILLGNYAQIAGPKWITVVACAGSIVMVFMGCTIRPWFLFFGVALEIAFLYPLVLLSLSGAAVSRIIGGIVGLLVVGGEWIGLYINLLEQRET